MRSRSRTTNFTKPKRTEGAVVDWGAVALTVSLIGSPPGLCRSSGALHHPAREAPPRLDSVPGLGQSLRQQPCDLLCDLGLPIWVKNEVLADCKLQIVETAAAGGVRDCKVHVIHAVRRVVAHQVFAKLAAKLG